jgi:4-hydroxy-3-polyprenylbenzoate decarboxylase
MGSITQMLTENSNNTAPAILFDEVPGYSKGFRTLYGHFSTIKRVALTLGLPLEQQRKVDIVRQFHARMQNMKALPPRFVKDGPILQNVMEGDACDVLKFPVPRHHEQDKARFIGTADCVVTQDPDKGWFNLGAYRSQVYDGKTIGCQITEGKHGRIHRDIYFERGQPMKVVILCGQDPLLFLLSGAPMPDVSEYDLAGGLRGEPIDVIRGPYTGFPIPADCEIAIEGETVPGQTRPEGPFGEWMGYYSDDTQPRPYVNVKTILYRNDPIICCAPQHKPVDETGLLKGIAGAAQIWRALEASGVPDVLGVWNHEAGPATRFTVVQIRQRRLPRRRLCRQVERRGRRRHRRRRTRSSLVGDVHAVRSEGRYRSDPEGLGLEARPALSAGQLQQSNPDRRLHSLRHEAQEHVPDRGGRERRSADEAARQVPAHFSAGLTGTTRTAW